LKDAADLAMRHAGLLVEFNDRGLGIGAELSCGGAKRVRGLQRMSALHATPALLTAADVNVELAVNGPTRNLDLVLLVDMRLVDVAAAFRTSVRKRCLVGFVDLRGRFAMGLDAVILARLAARLFRLRLGRPLGERSSLAFAGAALLFEQARQAFDLCAERGDFAFETDTVKAWCFGHTFTLAGGVFFSCASLPRKCADSEEAGRRR
jgi:hypothetical protein